MGSKSLQTVGFGRRSVIHIYELQTLDYAFYVGSVLECAWPIAVSGLRLRRYWPHFKYPKLLVMLERKSRLK